MFTQELKKRYLKIFHKNSQKFGFIAEFLSITMELSINMMDLKLKRKYRKM